MSNEVQSLGMSGGGGSGGDIPPLGPRPDVPCANLAFDTTLTSPDQAIVQTLSVGDLLSLELRQGASGRNMIAAVTTSGDLAGAITDRTADLIRCLQDGFEFQAEITRINGGWVNLAVRAAP
jgi:hypothetical protein